VLHTAGTAAVIDLHVQGKSYPVLTRAVQRDVLRHHVTHVDFLAVRMDQLIEAQIPITLIGESGPVEDREAILMHPLDTLTVRALPDELPTHIDVDISVLTEIGQSITVADLKLPQGVVVVTDSETLLAALNPLSRAVATAAEEAAAEAEGAEAGEEDED
jgi:large subunit ribosomal protein L25